MVEEGAVDDSADLLNDCFDQIYDYFGDNMKFNEDTVVEFLRSNGYNVNEAIDYILEYCGVDQPHASDENEDHDVELYASEEWVLWICVKQTHWRR